MYITKNLNGSDRATYINTISNNDFPVISSTATVVLAPNDNISVLVWQNSGSPLNINDQTSTPGARISITRLEGSVGATGVVGPIGPIGPTGQNGIASNTGSTGATGPKGDTGLAGFSTNTGATGPSGTVGPTGPPSLEPMATVSYKNTVHQSINRQIDTAVRWQTLDILYSQGNTGLSLDFLQTSTKFVNVSNNVEAYQISVFISFGLWSPGDTRVVLIRKNSSSDLTLGRTSLSQGNYIPTVQCTGIVVLEPYDWFDIAVWHNSSDEIIINYYSDYTGEKFGSRINITKLRGTIGPTGLPGSATNTGATGPTGIIGNTGPTGLPGSATNTGATGWTGPTGSMGPTGMPGSAVNTGATGPMGPAMNPSNIYRNLIDSVVIITMITGGNVRIANQVFVGAGFFVNIDVPGFDTTNYRYIATAAHTILQSEFNLETKEYLGEKFAFNIRAHVINQYENNVYFRDSSSAINGKPPTPESNLTIMGIDKLADVALLRIPSYPGNNSLHLPIKNSRLSSIGEFINIIGNPLTYDIQSLCRGVIRDNKFHQHYLMESVITDASIYGGNSGGPMLTDDGYVIGIVSWGYDVNLAGAVASHLFEPILKYFYQNFNNSILYFPKGTLGITYAYIDFSYGVLDSTRQSKGVEIMSKIINAVPEVPINSHIIEIQKRDGTWVEIGQGNHQEPLFTEIHLRPHGTTMSIRYRTTWGQTSLQEISVSLLPIPELNDYPLSNYRKEPLKIREHAN